MIIKIDGSQKKELEEIAEEYSQQREQGLFKPSFLRGIAADMLDSDEVLLVAKSESGILQGVMQYKTIYFANYRDFLSRYAHDRVLKMKFSDLVNISGFQSNQFIHEIQGIETFPKLNGIGRSLIETAREDPDVAVMFLHSVSGAKKFYEKLGFKEVKSHHHRTSSYMVWQREEPPKTSIIKTIKNFFYI